MKLVTLTFTFCILALIARTSEEDVLRFLSPNKKLEYKVRDDGGAGIVNAQTGELVLDLEEAAETALATESGRVSWAPDSRRFAFNYRSGGRYFTCSVYELAGTKWKKLPDFESKAKGIRDAIARREAGQVKELGLPKDAYRRRLNDTWKVHRWIDVDTLEGFAYSEGSYVVTQKGEEEIVALGNGVFFTAKCDNKGGWKIVRFREASDAEVEKLLEGD